MIVSFSGHGHTERVAATVAEAAQADRLCIDDDGRLPSGGWERLARATLIGFASPTYMGGPAWQFKRFADESSQIWFERGWQDKLAAGITCSASMNGDKDMTLHYFMTLAMQHGMLWVGSGELPANDKDAGRNDVNYVGTFAGLAAVAPSDAAPDEMAPGDLVTARLFGERLAAVAAARS